MGGRLVLRELSAAKVAQAALVPALEGGVRGPPPLLGRRTQRLGPGAGHPERLHPWGPRRSRRSRRQGEEASEARGRATATGAAVGEGCGLGRGSLSRPARMHAGPRWKTPGGGWVRQGVNGTLGRQGASGGRGAHHIRRDPCRRRTLGVAGAGGE